jgi:hypothetical protein
MFVGARPALSEVEGHRPRDHANAFAFRATVWRSHLLSPTVFLDGFRFT